MIVGLKESIPCDQVISRNDKLNERRGTHLIFYISEGAHILEKEGSHISRALIKFFTCKEGRSFERGINLGRGAFSENYGNAAWPLNVLMPESNCSRTRFISHSKLV